MQTEATQDGDINVWAAMNIGSVTPSVRLFLKPMGLEGFIPAGDPADSWPAEPAGKLEMAIG